MPGRQHPDRTVRRLVAALEPPARGPLSRAARDAGFLLAGLGLSAMLLLTAELHLDGVLGLAVRAGVVALLAGSLGFAAHRLRARIQVMEAIRHAHDAMGEGVVLLEPATHEVLHASPAAAAIFGRELVGVDLRDTVCPSDRPMVDERRRLRSAGHRVPAHAALPILLPDGGRRFLEWATTPLTVDGRPLLLSIVRDVSMDIEPQALRIVDTVLGLARSLDAQVVAEGIEDDRQGRALADLGCALGQSQAFAPAAPAIAVEALLARAGEGRADRIRVYLCDDAPALRHLLRAYLELGGDMEVVGEAADGVGLSSAVGDSAADVVLLDLSMPRVDGLEALADLRAAAPDLGIVVLSGFEEHRMAAKALALGADRYVEKAAGMEVVRAAVRAVAAARRGTRALAEAA